MPKTFHLRDPPEGLPCGFPSTPGDFNGIFNHFSELAGSVWDSCATSATNAPQLSAPNSVIGPAVLTIAGSDSSGGAGIEADIKTFTAHQCFGLTCITALTAQNSNGVNSVSATDATFVADLLDATLSDFRIAAIKTGMLANSATVKIVAEKLRHYRFPNPVVVDPVMVATTGAQLLDPEAVEAYLEHLLPLATLITPNVPEAQCLIRQFGENAEIISVADAHKACQLLAEKTGAAVLLKGGHRVWEADCGAAKTVSVENCGSDSNSATVVDILYEPKRHSFTHFVSRRLNSENTHGTGCTLSASIASHLSRGEPLPTAIYSAIAFVHAGIISAPSRDLLGYSGVGPLNHVVGTLKMPFIPGYFVPFLKSHPKIAPLWRIYTETHPFLSLLGTGKLRKAQFIYYLRQDYRYLFHYSRAHMLAGFKSGNYATVAENARISVLIGREMALHVAYCTEFGVDVAQLVDPNLNEESLTTVAYTRYLTDLGMHEDVAQLKVALAPCLLGYGKAAKNVAENPESVKENNPYWRWVETYLSPEFTQATVEGEKELENLFGQASPEQVEKCVEIFRKVVAFEIAFWQQALDYKEDEE